MKSEPPNLHRQQENQATRCTKPAQAPNKPKKLKFPGTLGPLLSSCWNFCFFCFFWWLSMFGASSGLFFLFFWCLSMFCEVRVAKPAQAPTKTKKNTPLDAPNLHRHQKTKKIKFPGTMGPLLSSCWIFFFFGACRCLVHLVVCFFLFFLVPVNVSEVRVAKPAQAAAKKTKNPNH